eukprot:gnl/TRDRNA2_/TRDRNA2_173934_c0_seq3.p1 gnl/TRDRNA2_/TRDRNA2_173934_c0~~gnl/TRDRNA2_/TRDRNA2_173934_c0_seq3.p1  ORF type:complete len:655 (-),score=112.36 gnl/TRDRNA2_/TRDRNA2_173934_c0_seq3:34-1998(-)
MQTRDCQMMASPKWMLAFAGMALGQQIKANSRCPCLPPDSPKVAEKIQNNKLTVSHPITRQKYDYPADFGQGECKAWDATLPPDCADATGKTLLTGPGWCLDAWCYVDPKNCDGRTISDILPSVYFSDLLYSYETCGEVASFAKWQQAMDATAPELKDIAEGYVQEVKKAVEDVMLSVRDEETIISQCEGIPTTCPCKTCKKNEAWTARTTNNRDMMLDFRRSMIVLEANKYESNTAEVQEGKCVSTSVAAKFKKIAMREYNDDNRIAYIYFAHQQSGTYIQWPGIDWCVTDGGFDPRFRPWYAGAVSGPKDLILILDKSGSMASGGVDRWQPTKRAAKRVLDTLGDNDYATIITFSSAANMYDSDETLHAVTDKNRRLMKEWIEGQAAMGGTNYRAGFELASKTFLNAVTQGRSSGCLQTILFLTDGKDSSGFVADDLATLNLEGVVVFTYTFGEDADKELPKEIACSTNGIWHHVPDDGDVENIMAKYYLLFAASIDTSQVRWTEYFDSVSGTALAAGCLPAYDTSSVKALIGVGCLDLNVIVDLDAFKGKEGYAATWKSMLDAATACPSINFAATTLQRMRREASGSQGVCGAPVNAGPGGSQDEGDAIGSESKPIVGEASGAAPVGALAGGVLASAVFSGALVAATATRV